MNTSAPTLIHLDGVTKVFFTDEVETHALAGIHLEIKTGEYIAIAGPSGCGKSTLLSILGLLDSPTEGKYILNGKSVADLPLSERARVRNREIGFIFQSFNLIGDLERLRERRAAAHLSRHEVRRAQGARHGGAREGRHGASREAPAQPALGRSAAARRRRPRGRGVAVDPAGRRADRKPRLEERRGGHGAPPRAAPRGRDHLHGHARPALRAARRSIDSPVRRPRRRRGRDRQAARRERARRERLRRRRTDPALDADATDHLRNQRSDSPETVRHPVRPSEPRVLIADDQPDVARSAPPAAEGRRLPARDRLVAGRRARGGRGARVRRRAHRPQLRARHDLRRRRPQPPVAHPGHRSDAAGRRDDGVGQRRGRRRGDAARRARLRPEAVGQRAAARHHPHADRAEPGAAERSAPRGRELAAARRGHAEADRRVRGDAERAAGHLARRAVGRERADPRRERHRQGSRRARAARRLEPRVTARW